MTVFCWGKGFFSVPRLDFLRRVAYIAVNETEKYFS